MHTGKVAVGESNQRWRSDGFEFSCDKGEKLRGAFALDCCAREALYRAVSIGRQAAIQLFVRGVVGHSFCLPPFPRRI